jgi:sortase A
MTKFNFRRILDDALLSLRSNESVRKVRNSLGLPNREPVRIESSDEPTMPKRPPGRPPKFMTPAAVAQRDLTPRELLQRNVLMFVAVTIAMFLTNLFVFSHIQHASSQEQLRIAFTEELALATAPTSEGDENLILLADGDPVAFLEIPEIGVSEVIVEGTDSTALRSGPGHRRDTVLPGQAGTSVIMGRASAFGGPFGSIHTLKPGTLFSVVTGQGQHTYKVIGMRYAGEPEPAPPGEGVSRIVLETGRGLPYSPSGVTRVDAQMVATSLTYASPGSLTGLPIPCVPTSPSPSSTATPTPETSASATPAADSTSTPSPSSSLTPAATTPKPGDCAPSTAESPSATPQPETTSAPDTATGSATFDNSVVAYAAGARLTSVQTLPLEHRVMASDVSTVWALVFALQFLVLVEIVIVWSVRRFGMRKAWVAGIPLVLLASILVSDQFIRMLPNLT